MSGRSSLVALALLALLGSWYYFYEFKGKEAREKAAGDAKLLFPGFEPDKVESLVLEDHGFVTELKKAGGSWRIVKPIETDADASVLGTVLEAFKTIKREDVADETGAEAAAFGLLTPTGRASFKAGASEGALRFGTESPTREFSYAQKDGEKAILMVPRFAKGNITKELKELRDKSVWSFQAGEVESIKSSFGKGLLVTRQGDAWKVGSEPGNAENIKSWISQLQGLRVETFLDEKGKNPGNYGIGAGNKRFEVKLTGRPKPLVLRQGSVEGKAKEHFYQMDGRPLIFSMAQYAQPMLEKKAEELADRDAFGFKSFDVARFELKRGAKTLKAVKKDGVWNGEGFGKDFDFYGFVSGLSSAKATARFPKEGPPASPSAVVTLYGEKDEVLETISMSGSKAYSSSKKLMSTVDTSAIKFPEP